MDTTELREQLAELHPNTFGWALSCCGGNRPLAEDVLQSAYLRVLDGRAIYRGHATFKTWLFGVVRNSAREERRRQLLRRAGLLRYETVEIATPDPVSTLSGRENCHGIRVALSKLSARQQEVLHLVFYQDLTIEQAASIMAISVGSARTHYERGKRQLRRLLDGEEDGDNA